MSNGARLRRFLVGFDGSREAVVAIDLAAALHAELTVLSVLPDLSHLETLDARAAAERSARAQLEAQLTAGRLHAASASVPLADVVVGGDPAGTIARHADEHGFDLVVVGCHGRERTTHGGMGRVVERLLRDPRWPVLVAGDPAGR